MNPEYVAEAFAEIMAKHPRSKIVRESFDQAMAMIRRDDRGWVPIYGSRDKDDQFGLTLDNLKDWDRKISESVIGAPWIGGGFRLRFGLWDDGIRYSNLPEATQGRKNVKELIKKPANQAAFFGEAARRQRELCLFSAGIAFWEGNDSTKILKQIPLRQIKDQMLEPNGLGYAIAYRREWTERDIRSGKNVERKEWIFTDEYDGDRPDSVVEEGTAGGANEDVPVAKKKTLFVQHANRPAGLVYGAPDALAAYVWNSITREAYLDGTDMTKALARFAMKATAKNKKAADGAIQAATTDTAGTTLVLGAANDLTPLASAGKGYDFESLIALVSVIATALGVSAAALASTPEGGGDTLDLPTRMALAARRREHADFDTRILVWMGAPDAEVTFKPFGDGGETYRQIQSLSLELRDDIISRDEYREASDDLRGRANGTVPTEDKRPSVLAAKAMAKAVPKPEPTPAPGADEAKGQQVASPDQGRSNGTGGQRGGNASNDIRNE